MGAIDKKIKKLIKTSVLRNHRSLFVILGSSGAQQIKKIYQLLSRANKRIIQTLWCSKDVASILDLKNDEHNDSISDMDGTNPIMKPNYCSYSDLDKVSHQSFNLVVLQDFESSSLLALNFVLSSVKGGGAIILLLPNLTCLEDLKYLNLREGNQVSRFSKRFVHSLSLCSSCIILNDDLTVLSSSSKPLEKSDDMITFSTSAEKIEELKSKHSEDDVMIKLLALCLTGDQAELLFKYLDVLKKRTFHAIVSVSSAFGRGKSAALGLAIAGSLALNYSNIFISSSCHSNVNVLFQFLLKGLDALQYKEDKDYDLIESANPKFNRALIGLNVFRDHPQSVRFVFPDDIGHKLEQAELVVIDEAASIPLHKLKHLIGPYVVLMSSTVCGAKSTSPYLYDTMVDNLQLTSKLLKESNSSTGSSTFSLAGSSLQKLSIKEPVHYSLNDDIESWNNQLFCMESATSSQLTLGCPETQQCQLFCVSRDALFNCSALSERFLQSLMSIFNQSSYVIRPEDFLKLADSPDYQIFVLLPPVSQSSRKTTPEVLCAILVHLEYELPTDIVQCGSNFTESIPKCFNKWNKKLNLSLVQGIHILNLATHPCYKRMGYGLRAFQLLQEMYEKKWISLEEKEFNHINDKETSQVGDEISKIESPLLLRISEVKLEDIQYICVSFNLTVDVFSFWKKAGFVPIFMKTETNSDSNVCFMMKSVAEEFEPHLQKNCLNFRNYYFTLLNSHCQSFPSSFALSFLNSSPNSVNAKELTKEEVDIYLKPYHMKSLEKYCQRLQDLHSIIHVIPIISKLYFRNCFKDIHLPVAQEAILLSYGLQNKSVELIAKDMGLQSIQVIGLLNRTIRKLNNYLTNIIEKTVEKSLVTSDVKMEPISQGLDEELEEAAKQIKKQQEDKLHDLDVAQYAIKGSEDEWQKALFSGRKTLVSIKSIKKKVEVEASAKNESKKKFKKPMKKKKK